MKELDTYRARKRLALLDSTTGTAGKAMLLMGGGALLVPLVAAFIPFVGTLALASVLIVLGILFWE